MADELLAEDGCLNFFAGRRIKTSKCRLISTTSITTAARRRYIWRFNGRHERGDCPCATGQLQPSFMVTHIGGLDACQKPCSICRISLAVKNSFITRDHAAHCHCRFCRKRQNRSVFKELARLVEETHGIWNEQARNICWHNLALISGRPRNDVPAWPLFRVTEQAALAAWPQTDVATKIKLMAWRSPRCARH